MGKTGQSRGRFLLFAGLLCAIILLFAIHSIVNVPYDPVASVQSMKQEIPGANRLMSDHTEDISILLDMSAQITDEQYEFTASFGDKESEMTVMYLRGSTYDQYYEAGVYALSSMARPYTFSEDEIAALENILRAMGKQGWITIKSDGLKMRIHETRRSVFFLTSYAPSRDNSAEYYYEQTEYGLNLEILFLPRF